MIKLSKRLEVISSFVPFGSRIVDVGCDHGLLSIYLCQSGIARKVIAADVNENALNNARENVKKNKLDKKIEVRLGSGLDVIDSDDLIDTVVIAGMGAHTIVGILKNNISKLESIDTLVIQSNTKIEFLRREVCRLGYKIIDEELVSDNKKIYTVIKFVKGKCRYSKGELYFGPILKIKNSELFKKNNKIELDKLYILLKMMPRNKIIDRYKIKKKIRMYKSI